MPNTVSYLKIILLFYGNNVVMHSEIVKKNSLIDTTDMCWDLYVCWPKKTYIELKVFRIWKNGWNLSTGATYSWIYTVADFTKTKVVHNLYEKTETIQAKVHFNWALQCLSKKG